MIPRILELQNPGNYISLERGNLKIINGDEQVGSVPVADVGVVLVSNTASSISSAAIAALLENGALLVFCGRNFLPLGVLHPINLHTCAHERLNAQMNLTAPVKKQIWAKLVRAKVSHQAELLEITGSDASALRKLGAKIRAGDPLNIEAQAARYYWPRLFGPEFRRNTNGDGVNALLNYGYTVIRAALARAVIAAGLSAAYPLHHSAKENPLALIDDLMEPFRPLVDAISYKLTGSDLNFICPDTKRELCSVLTIDIETSMGTTTLPQVFQELCHTFIRTIKDKAPFSVPDLSITLNSIITDFDLPRCSQSSD